MVFLDTLVKNIFFKLSTLTGKEEEEKKKKAKNLSFET